MKFFRLAVAALAAVFLITLSGCAREKEIVNPPFFKVTDEQTGGVVYLFGTMHAAPKNIEFSREVYKALDECDALAVEVDLQELDNDEKRLNDAMKLLECDNAAEFMGENYGEIRDSFENLGLYNPAFDRYIPAVWSSLLTNKITADCGYYAEYGADRLLLSYAKKNKIEIRELESVELQYSINAAEPKKLQIYLLKSSVETDYGVLKEQMKGLYNAWSKGDCAELERMLYEDEVPENLQDEYDFYFAQMYENRQKAMAEKIAEYLENGEKVFVAVGAMHYVAAPDILDLLGEQGFKAA